MHFRELARPELETLNAEVNALERLQIVRGRKSSYLGSKYKSCTVRARCFGASSLPSTNASQMTTLAVTSVSSLRCDKELDPIPQFKATAKLGEFLEARFSQSF